MSKSKLTSDQWKEIERRYSIGDTCYSLGKAYGVSKQAVDQRSKREGWSIKIDPDSASSLVAQVDYGNELQGCDKFTPEVGAILIDAMTRGANKTVACGLAGITLHTLADWVKRSPVLERELRRGQSMNWVTHHSKVSAAGQRDWRASQYLMDKSDVGEGSTGGEGNKLQINIGIVRKDDDDVEVITIDNTP